MKNSYKQNKGVSEWSTFKTWTPIRVFPLYFFRDRKKTPRTIMEMDQSEKENSDSLVANSVRSHNEDSEDKVTSHYSPSKNGTNIGSPKNVVSPPKVINSPKSAAQNIGTNGVRLSYKIDDYIPPSSKSNHDLRNTFSWEGLLQQPEFVAAPVSAFRHAPMSDCWENIIVGMKVSVLSIYPHI